MKKPIRERVLTKTALLIAVIFLVSIGTTHSYFTDKEINKDINLNAGSILITVTDNDGNQFNNGIFAINNLQPNTIHERKIQVKNVGSLNFFYKLSVVGISGDTDLCANLKFAAITDKTIQFEGNLPDLATTPLLLEKNSQSEWLLQIKLYSPNTAMENKTCRFNFLVKAWQKNSDSSWGLTSQQAIADAIAAQTFLPSSSNNGDILGDDQPALIIVPPPTPTPTSSPTPLLPSATPTPEPTSITPTIEQ